MITALIRICAILSLAASLCSAHRTQDVPISDELYETITQRAKILRAELDELGAHEWAGVYYQGDHHPTEFTITPKGGFLVTSSLHTFSPSWVNYGPVEHLNGRIRIFPELSDNQKSAHVMSKEFVLVKWDGYRLLVPPDQLKNFAYAVHSRSGSATVDYFTKSTESDPKGFPSLPKEYSSYLKMSPIITSIVKVKGDSGDYSPGTVTINAGRRKGVIKGMSFFLLGTRNYLVTLRVDDVSDDRAECHVSSFGTSIDLPDGFWVKPGWRFSSRMPKTFAR